MVEDDGAVWPTVMVDQTQVGEKTYTHSLQASLVTQGESITLDLQRHTERGGRDHVPKFISKDVFPYI